MNCFASHGRAVGGSSLELGPSKNHGPALGPVQGIPQPQPSPPYTHTIALWSLQEAIFSC